MKIGEDVRTSLRSIRKRPVESLLLIVGIALGIGATAAGVIDDKYFECPKQGAALFGSIPGDFGEQQGERR